MVKVENRPFFLVAKLTLIKVYLSTENMHMYTTKELSSILAANLTEKNGHACISHILTTNLTLTFIGK